MFRVLSIAVMLFGFCSLCATVRAEPSYFKNLQMSDSEILSALDQASWVPDGSANERHVYVVAAPWCSACKTLYADSRQLVESVQLRWIMTGGVNDKNSSLINGILSKNRSIMLLGKLFTTGKVPVSDGSNQEIVNAWNELVKETLRNNLKLRAGKSTGFPTLVFYDGQKCHVVSGLPKNLPGLMTKVGKRPIARDIVPLAAQECEEPFVEYEREGNEFVATVRVQNAIIYAGPSEKSLKVASAPKDYPLIPGRVIGREGEPQWMQIEVYTGLGGWTKLSNF